MESTLQPRKWMPAVGLQARAAALVSTTAIALLLASPSMQAQTFTVLHFFSGGDGQFPYAGLVRDKAGNLYGTTLDGGAFNKGTVFKIDKQGAETVLKNFKGEKDGEYPYAALFRDASGCLYGTTELGGEYGAGTAFKLHVNPTTGRVTKVWVHSFRGSWDGGAPYGVLIHDKAGNVYGTSSYGGAHYYGTVFKLDKTGQESVLYSFKGGTDGSTPYSGLASDSAGNLYGTTAFGGAFSRGTVFELAATGKETVLYSFSGGTDGAYPFAGLVVGDGGVLYGTTNSGGDAACNYGSGCGVVFKMDTTGKENVLYSFTSGMDGANPYAGLILDREGNLYGTTEGGGDYSNPDGTVFKIDKEGAETVLHRFVWSDGAFPYGTLARDSKGDLYGTAFYAGSGGGTVFKIRSGLGN
jgi:uncharacterized repeat protein (TIGR03803 family)